MSLAEDGKRSAPRTPADIQRRKLEKLMENIDRPVHIPEPASRRQFPAPPEFVRNVMGSSAGAGSGEFHVYRHIRRREYARVKHINQQAEKDALDEEFRLRVEKNKAAEEERTAKKRAKRQRQKARKAERNAKKPRPSNSEEAAINSANDTDEYGRDPNSESSMNATPDSHQDVGGTREQGSKEDRGTTNDPGNSVSHELDHAPLSHPVPHTS